MGKCILKTLSLFCLLASLMACVYGGEKPRSSLGKPHLADDSPLPKRMYVRLYKLTGQRDLSSPLEEETHLGALKELKGGLHKPKVNLVEDEGINLLISCKMEGKDFDFTCFWEENTKLGEAFNLDTILIGWYGTCSENHPSKYYFYGPYLNNCCRIKMKLIDVKTRRTIWFGETGTTAWTKEAAIRKAISEFLKLLGRDFNMSMGDIGRTPVNPSQNN